MMKCNRSRFTKIKWEFEMLKMKSAYILAERAIMANPQLTGFQDVAEAITGFKFESKQMNPEEFIKIYTSDEDGNMVEKSMTIKEMQISQLEGELKEIEELGQKLLSEEKYELMQEAKEMYDRISNQLNKLRGNK